MTTLLVACAALITSLTMYSMAHYFCAAVSLWRRPRQRTFTLYPSDAVSVLVPARNEGDSALRVLASLAAQDHRGPLDTYLLVKDHQDSSIACLAALHPELDLAAPAPATIELSRTGDRRVFVVYTGLDPKSEKVNWLVERLSTPYLAILDCDHQARPDWVRTCLCLLHEKKARIVQAGRGPLVAHGFFPLWDSLHQHIGCELFNVAFSALGLPLYFTGTTALMETSLLKAHPLSRCLTEDVYFSYTILQHGVRIIHNPYSGSDEETSPDLYSFLARRRRWANGHTEAFFKHLGLLRAAPVTLRERVQFLLHGAHYLVSVMVFVLHLIIGSMFARELSPVSAGAAALASVMLAWLVARTQRTAGFVGRATELAVLFAWLAPAVLIAMNLAQAVLTSDPSRTLLPGPKLFHAIGLVGLCAPLVVLIAGLIRFRQLGLGSLLAVLTTYVAAFYLDLCGVLLGVADFATGGAKWRVVNRAPAATSEGDSGGTGRLSVPMDLKESWRLGRVMESAREVLKRGLPEMTSQR